MAIGYPRVEVEAFTSSCGLHGVAYKTKVARAIAQGQDIPVWLAYLSHVPMTFEFSGKGSGSTMHPSEALGRGYMELVRSTNPRLAAEVEAEHRKELKRLARGKREWKATSSDSPESIMQLQDYAYELRRLRRRKIVSLGFSNKVNLSE